jgi:hypothetical protein
LTGFDEHWVISRPRLVTHRLYEWIKLNVAWESLQRLGVFSGDLATTAAKRVVYKRNEDFKWLTQYQNYQVLAADETNLDQYQVAYNAAVIDAKKDLTALAAWTANQLAGTNLVRKNMSVRISPIDWGMAIGAQLADSGAATGATVAGIRHDIDRASMEIMATNRD